MSSRQFFLLIAFISLVSVCNLARAQENQAADPNAPPPPPGVDKYYWDLSQLKDPKDRAIKSMAERYVNLVKVQEWGDLSGKFRTVARYVKHDPNFTTVTIESVKGRGAERTTKEVTVPVDKLSKTCQSRVKQIDTMQKKIKEMAKTKPGENGAVPGASPEGPGGPMPDAPGPGLEAAPTSPPAAAAPDPSASEPDPLGFGEIPLTPGPEGVPPPAPGIPPGTGAETAPAPQAEVPAGAASRPASAAPATEISRGIANRRQWRTSYDAFAANFLVALFPGQGKSIVDWGEIKELGEMNALAEAKPIPPGGVLTASPEIAAISERLGDFNWQLDYAAFGRTASGEVGPSFKLRALPEPIEIKFVLAEKEEVQAWSSLPTGSPIHVTGRLQILQPNKITAIVRLANEAPTAPAGDRR